MILNESDIGKCVRILRPGNGCSGSQAIADNIMRPNNFKPYRRLMDHVQSEAIATLMGFQIDTARHESYALIRYDDGFDYVVYIDNDGIIEIINDEFDNRIEIPSLANLLMEESQ